MPRVPGLPAALVAGCLALAAGARGTDSGASLAPPPAVASYRIAARLDAERHQVAGTELLTWRNATEYPARELRFHLYLNAFRSSASTWSREADRDEVAGLGDDAWGWIEVRGLRDAAGRDLLPALEPIAPDDGNPADRTVVRLPLPEPVPPGGRIELTLDFLAQLPALRERTGWLGNFHFVGQWFPKLGVFGPDGLWNCHQFHRNSEFFADFGSYEARLTVPAGFVVGATGRRVAERQVEGGVELTYRQEGVHDFAWTAWPGFVERRRTVARPGLPDLELRLLLRRETAHHAERLFAALAFGLDRLGAWFGPYPYAMLTVVDPPWGAEPVGGMEYPTLFTLGTSLLSPRASGEPEALLFHELAHQWFHGLLASDEFEEPFLDEGLATYAAARLLADAGPPPAVTVRLWGVPWVLDALRLDPRREQLVGYFGDPASDPIARTAWGFLDGDAYGRLVYDKAALLLFTLERRFGEAPVRAGLARYAERYRFGHPRASDLEACLVAAAGPEVATFFQQILRGSETLDYAIGEATTHRREPAGGRADEPAPAEPSSADEAPPGYESVVTVRRHGGVQLPVEVELTFAHGTPLRLTWAGRDRWVRYRIVGPRLIAAAVDPDRELLLDVEPANDSLTVEPDRRASRAWGQRLRFWIQGLFAALAELS